MQHLDINMAEDEINIEDEAIALEDAEDTSVTDANVSSIVDHVMASFKSQRTTDTKMNKDGLEHIETIEVYMDLMFNLLKQKNLEYL